MSDTDNMHPAAGSHRHIMYSNMDWPADLQAL